MNTSDRILNNNETYYVSRAGVRQTYLEWEAEAKKTYNDLGHDKDVNIKMPKDWWVRWQRLLGIAKEGEEPEYAARKPYNIGHYNARNVHLCDEDRT